MRKLKDEIDVQWMPRAGGQIEWAGEGEVCFCLC